MGNIDTLLKIIEIVVLVGGGFGAAFTIGRMISRFEASQASMSTDIVDLKEDIKQMSKLMTAVALQNQRLGAMEDRMNSQDKHIDDLRRGRGFISGSKGVDGEY